MGVYGGFGAAVGGVMVFRALYLGGYDTMKHIYNLDDCTVMTRYFVAQVSFCKQYIEGQC